MKVLVTGARGQLGQEVMDVLQRRGEKAIALDLPEVDVTAPHAVTSFVREAAPDAIIHCAAFTDVDRAETKPEVCMRINAEGTLNMAHAAAAQHCPLMLISTDYVFPGEGDQPLGIKAHRAPLNVYGQSKLQAEWTVTELLDQFYIVRTSWLFGPRGENFVRKILRLGAEKKSLRVVDDQIGSPTYAPHLAQLLCDMIVSGRYGIYHATSEGFCSFADFAEAILAMAHLPCQVQRVPSSAYPSNARRPLNSRLDKTCLDEAGFARLPRWQDGLAQMFAAVRGAAV